MTAAACELCDSVGGEVVHHAARYRIVLVDDPAYPGFCRVVWNGHVREMTDLPREERHELMAAVWEVEAAVREVMAPHKVNLASLGNMMPHLHWHVIPRYSDDAHFPTPVWSTAQRQPDADTLLARAALLPALRAEIVRRMTAGVGA